jgi:hypothetical protein
MAISILPLSPLCVKHNQEEEEEEEEVGLGTNSRMGIGSLVLMKIS